MQTFEMHFNNKSRHRYLQNDIISIDCLLEDNAVSYRITPIQLCLCNQNALGEIVNINSFTDQTAGHLEEDGHSGQPL